MKLRNERFFVQYLSSWMFLMSHKRNKAAWRSHILQYLELRRLFVITVFKTKNNGNICVHFNIKNRCVQSTNSACNFAFIYIKVRVILLFSFRMCHVIFSFSSVTVTDEMCDEKVLTVCIMLLPGIYFPVSTKRM